MKTTTYTLRLTDEDKNQWIDLAKQANLTLAQWIIRACQFQVTFAPAQHAIQSDNALNAPQAPILPKESQRPQRQLCPACAQRGKPQCVLCRRACP